MRGLNDIMLQNIKADEFLSHILNKPAHVGSLPVCSNVDIVTRGVDIPCAD